MNSNTNNNPTNNITTKSKRPRLTSILGSFLETAIHELIYLRSLYPHDAFSPSRHLQIAVHACRHPDVVDYIFHTLNDVAVTSIISGSVDGLYLIFYDEATNVLYERYGFEFDFDFDAVDGNGNHNSSKYPKEEVGYIAQELERSLRDVLLSIISLQGTDMGRRMGERNFTDTTTFKLCLHTKKLDGHGGDNGNGEKNGDNDDENEICPELKAAIQSGKWMKSDMDSCQLLSSSSGNVSVRSSKSVSRPLKSLNVPSCGLRMQVMIDMMDIHV